jgi:hypothetical protein
MRIAITLSCLCIPAAALAQAASLAPADEAAAFAAAGFTRVGGQWRACEDPDSPSYQAGAIEQVVDLNGDGRPEAIIAEHSGYCYGMQGSGYMLVSKQAGGGWTLVTSGSGMLTPLESRGAGGWRDLEIGGPGFCFAVQRWNGSAYVLHRWEYEGKACKPDG